MRLGQKAERRGYRLGVDKATPSSLSLTLFPHLQKNIEIQKSAQLFFLLSSLSNVGANPSERLSVLVVDLESLKNTSTLSSPSVSLVHICVIGWKP